MGCGTHPPTRPTAAELALVFGLAVLTEHRDDDEQAALEALARHLDSDPTAPCRVVPRTTTAAATRIEEDAPALCGYTNPGQRLVGCQLDAGHDGMHRNNDLELAWPRLGLHPVAHVGDFSRFTEAFEHAVRLAADGDLPVPTDADLLGLKPAIRVPCPWPLFAGADPGPGLAGRVIERAAHDPLIDACAHASTMGVLQPLNGVVVPDTTTTLPTCVLIAERPSGDPSLSRNAAAATLEVVEAKARSFHPSISVRGEWA